MYLTWIGINVHASTIEVASFTALRPKLVRLVVAVVGIRGMILYSVW